MFAAVLVLLAFVWFIFAFLPAVSRNFRHVKPKRVVPLALQAAAASLLPAFLLWFWLSPSVGWRTVVHAIAGAAGR